MIDGPGVLRDPMFLVIPGASSAASEGTIEPLTPRRNGAKGKPVKNRPGSGRDHLRTLRRFSSLLASSTRSRVNPSHGQRWYPPSASAFDTYSEPSRQ